MKSVTGIPLTAMIWSLNLELPERGRRVARELGNMVRVLFIRPDAEQAVLDLLPLLQGGDRALIDPVHRDRVAGEASNPVGLDAIVVNPTNSPFRLTTAPPLIPRLSLASSWSSVGKFIRPIVVLGAGPTDSSPIEFKPAGNIGQDAPARGGRAVTAGVE